MLKIKIFGEEVTLNDDGQWESKDEIVQDFINSVTASLEITPNIYDVQQHYIDYLKKRLGVKIEIIQKDEPDSVPGRIY